MKEIYHQQFLSLCYCIFEKKLQMMGLFVNDPNFPAVFYFKVACYCFLIAGFQRFKNLSDFYNILYLQWRE